MKLRTTALALVISALLLAVSASAASAYSGKVWLNWGAVPGHGITYSGFTHLKQVSTQPRSYYWGCGNMWTGSHYVFGTWYCGGPEGAANSPDLGGNGEYAEPVALNEEGREQQLWAWEYYA